MKSASAWIDSLSLKDISHQLAVQIAKRTGRGSIRKRKKTRAKWVRRRILPLLLFICSVSKFYFNNIDILKCWKKTACFVPMLENRQDANDSTVPLHHASNKFSYWLIRSQQLISNHLLCNVYKIIKEDLMDLCWSMLLWPEKMKKLWQEKKKKLGRKGETDSHSKKNSPA